MSNNFQTPQKKLIGRKSGVKNYKNEVLLSIIENKLPTSAEEWFVTFSSLFDLNFFRYLVNAEYKKTSGENMPRETADLKKHFFVKLCNNGIKPTGDSGKTLTERAQRIQRIMFEKESAGEFVYSDKDYQSVEEDDIVVDEQQQQEQNISTDWTSDHSEVESPFPESKKRKAPTVDLRTKNSRNKSRHSIASSIQDMLSVIKQPKQIQSSNANIETVLVTLLKQQQQINEMFQMIQGNTRYSISSSASSTSSSSYLENVRNFDEDKR